MTHLQIETGTIGPMSALSPRKRDFLSLGEIGIVERSELFDELVQHLTVNELAGLVARAHEKKSTISKSRRFGLYPIEDWAAFERMKRLEASYWTANAIKFSQDRDDFLQFTPEERWPLLKTFGFFAIGDGSIASMLAFQMILTAPSVAKQFFYVVQLLSLIH